MLVRSSWKIAVTCILITVDFYCGLVVSWCGLIHIRKKVRIGYIQFYKERQTIDSFHLPTSQKVVKREKSRDYGVTIYQETSYLLRAHHLFDLLI